MGSKKGHIRKYGWMGGAFMCLAYVLETVWDVLGVTDSECPLSLNLACHQQALSPLRASNG